MPKTKVKKKKIDLDIKQVPYHHDAKVVCSCGAKFEVGSTLESINVEVCSRCHPFYTGTQKLVDTSGRVDKFKSRLAKQEAMKKDLKESKESNESKNSNKSKVETDRKDSK
jgi:large subunit ribosomal protein L31